MTNSASPQRRPPSSTSRRPGWALRRVLASNSGSDAGRCRCGAPLLAAGDRGTHHDQPRRAVGNLRRQRDCIALRRLPAPAATSCTGAEPIAFQPAHPPAPLRLNSCLREGFATASVFSLPTTSGAWGVQPVFQDTSGTRRKTQDHAGNLGSASRCSHRKPAAALPGAGNGGLGGAQSARQELHDSIAQGLAFLNIQVQLLDDSPSGMTWARPEATVESLREGIRESYDHVRELLVHFRTRVGQSELSRPSSTRSPNSKARPESPRRSKSWAADFRCP